MSKTPTLDQISLMFEEFSRAMLESGGIVTDEMAAHFTELLEIEASKADAYAFRVKALQSDEARWVSLAKECASKAAAAGREREFLFARIAAYLATSKQDELKGEYFRFQWENNGGKAPIVLSVDPAALPERWLKPQEPAPPREVDVEALRAALKVGDQEAKRLASEQRGRHLKIR